jgi:NADH-quinone oxidoreductase subunit C
VIRLSSADPEAPDSAPPEDGSPTEVDELREGIVATLREHLGDVVLDHHIDPGVDVWVRVDVAGWRRTAEVLRDELSCTYFDFLSAIDWMPSPFGRDMDAQEDGPGEQAPDESAPMEQGVAGGDTRFQLLARVHAPTQGYGVFIKADLDDATPSVETLVPVYAGANWHEREAAEMFGIDFPGHPYLVKLYLPGGFEGHPLRKDFPLLSRRVKPWPGIVDVEVMPGDDDGDAADDSPPVTA